MLDTLTQENWRDFGQRYVDTFAFFIPPGTDNRRLCYITHSDDREVSFRTSADGLHFSALRDSGTMFEFIQVDKAWVMGAAGVPYLLQRVPARQWRRGIARNNTSIYYLDEQSKALQQAGVNWKTMREIFGDKAKRPCGYADVLSKHFLAVTDGALLFYANQAGECITRDNRKVIRLPKDSLVVQEVVDVLRRTGKDKDYTLEITDV